MIRFQFRDGKAIQVNEDDSKYVAESLFESEDFQSNIAVPVQGEQVHAAQYGETHANH